MAGSLMVERARRPLLTLVASLVIGNAFGTVAAAHTVTIDGLEFRPAIITVNQGDTVEWRNNDPLPHTVSAKDAALASSEIAAHGTFRFTAKTKGRFSYICTLHATMKGELIVR